MLSDKELQAALNRSPAKRVTKEDIEKRIKSRNFTRFSETVTVCEIMLDNGYSVRGESACVNPENYNQQIGERISFDNAFEKLWPLFGFLLAEENKNSTDKCVDGITVEGDQISTDDLVKIIDAAATHSGIQYLVFATKTDQDKISCQINGNGALVAASVKSLLNHEDTRVKLGALLGMAAA